MAAKVIRLLSCTGSVICKRSSTFSSAASINVNSGKFRLQLGFIQRSTNTLKFAYRMSSADSANVDSVKGEELATMEPATKEEPVQTTQDDVCGGDAAIPEFCQPLSSHPTDVKCKPLRVQKIKVAIVLSFSGQGYCGMQIQNNGTRTIENDIIKALKDSGQIDDDGFQKPKSIKFQRAARTDKNVSAARQIISVLLPKTFDVDLVNKHLPGQIKLMDFRRVTKGFDAKAACSSRTYLYMIPTFAFTPLEALVQEDYRITPDVLETLRNTLKMYIGTKNYHNFTSRKKPTDPSAFRFIMDFTSSDPFMKDGLEYVVLKVKGQSFMLHQIRKMIGLAVAILRGFANEETMKKAFTLNRIDIPMAPGLGLMLGEAHYDQYNKRYGSDGVHESLIWDNVADKIEEFCQEKIYPNVTQTENEEKSMMQWLSTVPFHTYDERDMDGPPKGFGPLGKAHLYAKRLRGESDDEIEADDDEDDDDDEAPTKKRKTAQ